MVNTMSEKKKRVKLKPEEFVSQHDKIEEGVVHTRLRNKDGRWLDMFDYVPEGIGVDRLTNDGTKITKKEEKIFTIGDLNNMLIDIFRDDELCKNRIKIEITEYQKTV